MPHLLTNILPSLLEHLSALVARGDPKRDACQVHPRTRTHTSYMMNRHFKRQAYVQVDVKLAKTRLSALINHGHSNVRIFCCGPC
jgi:hypothetical protein